MEGKRILIVEGEKRPRKVALRALTATKSVVDAAEDYKQAEEMINNSTYDLVIADLEFAELINNVKTIQPKCKTALMSRARIEEYISEIRKLGFISNLVAKSSDDTAISARELITTSEKLLRNDIFGLDKYLRWGTSPYSIDVFDSRKRFDAIDEVVSYSQKLGASDRMKRIVVDLLDELFMNAFYDAPLDEDGNFKYADLNRSVPVIFPDNSPVVLEYASDGDFLGISVTDAWGTLNKDKIFMYLERCFAKGEDQIREDTGGAGLGLYKIFKSLNMFVVNIEKGVSTEVIGLIDLRISMREFKKRIRSFHIFNKEEIGE